MPNHLIIVFVGLISQFSLPVGHETFERAVLTALHDHSPLLVLRTSDVNVRPPGVMSKCNKGLPAGIECYDLSKSHLTIGDISSGGFPTPFDDHVPRLSKITTAKKKPFVSTPDKAVQNADTNFAYAFAYVDYSGGCVRAPRQIDELVTWKGCASAGPRCVAAYTVRDGASGSDPLKLNLDGKVFIVKPDSIIFIGNIALEHVGSDFKEHLWLNNGDCIEDLKGTKQICPDPPPITTSCDGKVADLRAVAYLPTHNLDQFALTLGNVGKGDFEVDCTQSQNPPP
jgi:hypothetical protein